MNNFIEIIVSANTSTSTIAGGTLDLMGDEDITLKLSVKDVRDVTSTKNSYSQSFTVYGTKNNRQIFQDLHLIGVDGNFDPRKKASCSIYVNSLPIIDGYIQVVSIDVNDRDMPTYNVTVFGSGKGFNTAIADLKLEDYNWSALDHVLNLNNIANSWSATTGTLGYYYSIKDFGYGYTLDSVKGKVQGNAITPGIPFGNMYPDWSNKYILDKIFSTAGYTYDSNFLSSTTFTETVIPFNGDPSTVMGSDYLSGRTFVATDVTLSSTTPSLTAYTISPYAIQPYTYDFEYQMRADVILSGAGSNVSTAYTQSNNGDYYTFDQPAISSFSVGVNYEYVVLPNAIRGQVGCRFYRSGYQNGTVPFYEDLSMEEVAGVGYRLFSTPPCDYLTTWNAQSQTLKPFSQGERVWAKLFFRVNLGYVAPVMSSVPFKITDGGWNWKHYPSAQRTSGQMVYMNNLIPKNVKATDYITSLINLFNLYIEPDKTNSRKLIIEPFDNFYGNGTQRNWSTKLDRSQPITEMLVSEEMAKQYTFTYKEDKDWLNEDYKTKFNEVYGQLRWDVENEFTTEDSKVEVIFSPTPVDNVIGSDVFIIPKIGKFNSNNQFNRVEHNLRFLRKNPTRTKLPTGQYFRFTGSTTYDAYPYVGHLDNPFSGTVDYNFGSVPKVYYPWSAGGNNTITENNLVNTYWKKYLNEITDKESKLITAFFKLTPTDISTFRFADTVYVEGLTSEGGHFFRVNSIEYSLTNQSLAKVELIKILNKYTSNKRSRFLVGTGVSVGYNGGPGGGTTISGNAKVKYPGSIGIGNGVLVDGQSAFAIGDDNLIGGSSNNTFVVGEANILGVATSGTSVFGANNSAYTNSSNVNVRGHLNTIKNDSQYITIDGSGNLISLTNKGRIIGNDNYVDINQTDRSENVKIEGNQNITYGLSTGYTVNGSGNAIFGGTEKTFVFGDQNTTIGTSGITINGEANYIESTTASNVLGSSNTTLGSASVNIQGNLNQLGVTSNNVFIAGSSNQIYGDTAGIKIQGDSNSVGNNTDNVYVEGDLNDIQAFVTGKHSKVIGSGNTFYATNSFVQGISNYVAVSAAIGENVKVRGTNNFVLNSVAPIIHGDDNTSIYSDRTSIFGLDNYVSEVSGSTVTGLNNILLSGNNLNLLGSGNTIHNTSDVLVHGDLNTIYTGATYSTVLGKNNYVGSASTNTLINGNNNIIPDGSQNVAIMGFDYWSATTNDITYMNNSYVETVLYMSNTSSSEQADGIAAGAVSNAFGSGSTSAGDYSFTTGYNNVANGFSSFATGGYSVAESDYSFVYGQNNSSSGYSSFVGGDFSFSQEDYSFITGVFTEGRRYAEWARSSSGNYGQYGSVMAFGTTTSASTSNLYLDSLLNKSFTIESNTSYMFKIKATAADYSFASSGYSACFEGSCLLKNVAGTVSAVGVPTVTQIYADSILSTSNIVLAADNTNKALSIVADSGTGPGMIWSVEVDYVKVKHNPL